MPALFSSLVSYEGSIAPSINLAHYRRVSTPTWLSKMGNLLALNSPIVL